MRSAILDVTCSVNIGVSWTRNRNLGQSPSRPNVIDVVDRDVDGALARSFLADLPAELVGRLRAEGERAYYPAGTTVYRAGDDPRAALVVGG